MRTVGNSKNQARKPGAECIPFPYNSCKKETGENPVFPPVLRQGQKDLVTPAAPGAAPQWEAPSTGRGGSRDRRSRVPPARTRPSARGFGVDVGGRTRERKRAGVARFLSQVLERAVLVWYCGKFPCVFYDLILSRLVDTFISKISLTMLPVPKPHNTACVLSWEEARRWQSRSSGYSSS